MRLHTLILSCLLFIGNQSVAQLRLQLEVEAPEPWNLTLGASAEITCSIDWNPDQRPDQTQALDLSVIQIQLIQTTLGAIQILASGVGPLTYTLGPISLQDRGLYSCEANGPAQKWTVEPDHQLLWVHDPTTLVTLQLTRVDRVRFFHSKKFTISCDLPHDGKEWKIMRVEKGGSISECPAQTRSGGSGLGGSVSCSVPSLPMPVSKSRQYEPFWCESSGGDKSNVLNLTQAEISDQNSRQILVATFDLSPAWFLQPGDSVTFTCEVKNDKYNNSDKCDMQLIHTKMGSGDDMTVVLSQRASQPINYTLDSVSQEHQGVWSCYDDGTLSNVLWWPWHHFLWIEDSTPPSVIIDVLNHNRTNFLHNELVTVGCRLPLGGRGHWRLMSVDRWAGVISPCPGSGVSVGDPQLLSCSQRLGYPWGHKVFWCESDLGQRSNALNISSTVIHSVLEAPPLPVTEGDDVTLRCLMRDKKTRDINVEPAVFRHHDRIISWRDDGVLVLKNVTKDNEGPYSCRVKSDVYTAAHYLTVKPRGEKD